MPLTEEEYRQAARYAVKTYVTSGMVIGLGLDGIMRFLVDELRQQIVSGELHEVRLVPAATESSHAMSLLADLHPITLEDLYPRHKSELGLSTKSVDLMFDAADEVDAELNNIRGAASSILCRRLLESNAKQVILMVDEDRFSECLGTNRPVPIEIVPFCWGAQADKLSSLECEVELQFAPSGKPYLSEFGNYFINCHFPRGISYDVGLKLDWLVSRTQGMISHGLFLNHGYLYRCIVAGTQGVRDVYLETD